MPDCLYGARLQGIMVDVFIKPCTRLINDEYNYCESLQARAIGGGGGGGGGVMEGIGHCEAQYCFLLLSGSHTFRGG